MTTMVVVLDDTPDVETLLNVGLREKGIHMVSFPDEAASPQTLRKQQEEDIPNVVLLTNHLSTRDMYKLLQYLRWKPIWHRLVVILLSGRDSRLDRLKTHLVESATHVYEESSSPQAIVDFITMYLRASPITN